MDNLKLCFLSSKDSSAVDSSSPSFDMFGSRRFQISGHCNGILCLSVGYRTKTKIVLYNPATRQFKCLPNSVIQDHSSFTISVGMGYDSRIDDYKVVRINSMGIAYGVEEYSLSTDSWTPLCKSNASDFRFGRFALFFRGTYYWWASRRWEYSSTTMILGLNMGDEVFRTVSVPREVACSKSGDRNKLLALWKNESICLIYSYGPERSPSLPMIDMWVMDGFGGDQVSWTKMHKITTNFPFLVGVQPLVFWKGNELLLETFFGEIKTYNVDTGEITSIKVEGPIVPGNTQAVNYVATLVSIKGGSFLPLT
ncbi:F-box/kelch-repeat protein At3g06240-like [Prosopis cineraria]|uniref:F-box/kelch-repeat protein At3g06240-like n=1 Tax=Prosopis cineraria TaxID=364024 RepID=UPI00240F98AA|nr:F-box/kelch-repeat protein At3g06240-like [Prosopis cineraria]